MGKIFSLHEYELKPDIDTTSFEQAILTAREQGLLHLPGLETSQFLRGIKGKRQGRYATLWMYSDRRAWEAVWGSADHPIARGDYPENWKIWEASVLAPFLNQDPDKITYTVYESF